MSAIVHFEREHCKGCELCILVCPKHILVLDATSVNAKGYHRPRLQIWLRALHVPVVQKSVRIP